MSFRDYKLRFTGFLVLATISFNFAACRDNFQRTENTSSSITQNEALDRDASIEFAPIEHIGTLKLEEIRIDELETDVDEIEGNLVTSPNSIESLSIDFLSKRSYGEGTLKIEDLVESNNHYAKVLISYPSDGLTIHGFMNVPPGDGPFPVVIFLHGYIDPDQYKTLDYSTRYVDDLASLGFAVIHPNLRGYPPSDNGPNLFRVGMAIDTLNLIGIIKRQAGKDAALLQMSPDNIGIIGHSMGGGITTRVISVSPSFEDTEGRSDGNPAVKAAVLYGAMSGDEAKNYYRIYWSFSGLTRGVEEISYDSEALEAISPMYYFDRIESAVQIHHGVQDNYVPVDWSRETCALMKAQKVSVECFEYQAQAHNFCCEGYKIFLNRVTNFFYQEFR